MSDNSDLIKVRPSESWRQGHPCQQRLLGFARALELDVAREVATASFIIVQRAFALLPFRRAVRCAIAGSWREVGGARCCWLHLWRSEVCMCLVSGVIL